MFKKLTSSLMLITSLLLLPLSLQTSQAESNEILLPPVQMIEKIDINQATSKQLATIKGVGKQKAQAIINYRQINGDFKSSEELLNIKGIGQSTLKKIKPFISL